MKLDSKPAASGRNFMGKVHRVLRNDVEVSAWSEEGEAREALTQAVAAEAALERSRLPPNVAEQLDVDATSVSFAPGGTVVWRTAFRVEARREMRGVVEEAP